MAESHASQAPSILRCASCALEIGITDSSSVCPACRGLLDIIHSPSLRGAALKRCFDSRVGLAAPGVEPEFASGVWRYRDVVLPGPLDSIVSYPEGNTPLLRRSGISEWAGVNALNIKHEGLNPTGSFKDRGMSVAVTQARRLGVKAVACASTGNTSSSLAAYAAIAGIPSIVLVPSGRVAKGKLAQTIAYGARVLLVRGDFDDCLRLALEASERLGVYLVNSVNPFRIEGQKTIVLELLQQLDWKAPDWIALPAGNLGNAAAIGKGIREAIELGLIRAAPRLLLVQAEGASPFVQSFRGGFAERHRVRAETVASAIRIGDPASYHRAVRAVRETDGEVVAVSDAEILEAKSIIDASGVGSEPASAASIAGVRMLVRQGKIAANHSVVAILTGHLLKDPAPVWPEGFRSARMHEAEEIDADLAEVERAIGNG